MATVTPKLAEAGQALRSFTRALAKKSPTVIDRDAAILRFAYTCEAAWKAAKALLSERQGLDANSPKACVRLSRQVGWLNDDQAEAALAMMDDRNLVVHTYNEALAMALSRRLAAHAKLLDAWIKGMKR